MCLSAINRAGECVVGGSLREGAVRHFYFQLAVIAIVISLAATSSSAFDGNRKGFLLGYGAGVGVSDVGGDRHTGLHTNLKIGAGISERLLLYYSGNFGIYGDLWFSPTAAVSYYPFSGASFLYFTGGLGASSASGWDEAYAGYNFHVVVGVGVHLSRHWNYELSVLSADSLPTVATLTLNVLGF
jgi:hypothetical protein